MNVTPAMVEAALDNWFGDFRPEWRNRQIQADLYRTYMRAALTAAVAVSGYGEVVEALREAALQIEYLHDKFQETGSGNTVLAGIRAALARVTPEPHS